MNSNWRGAIVGDSKMEIWIIGAKDDRTSFCAMRQIVNYRLFGTKGELNERRPVRLGGHGYIRHGRIECEPPLKGKERTKIDHAQIPIESSHFGLELGSQSVP